MSSQTPRGTAFLVENPDETLEDNAPVILAAAEAVTGKGGTADGPPSSMAHDTSTGLQSTGMGKSNTGQIQIGVLHDTPADPYQESDKSVAKERHALDLQYQAMTKGYTNADGTSLREVDAQMEAGHETYASYDAAGVHSAALKAAIAKQDAEVKRRIEQHAGGAPLLQGYDGRELVAGMGKNDTDKPPTEAEAFLQRMAELDAAVQRGVAEHDRIQF